MAKGKNIPIDTQASVKKKPGQPTQRYLDIAEIKEDAVVMKDGTLRAVLLVSSINFSLKSDDEQQAMVQSYMQFLNGLEHPIQICIQSRKMNIDGYMEKLASREREIENELLKTQIRDYKGFIRELVDLGQIMQKRFLVVIPYNPITADEIRIGFFKRVQQAFSPASVIRLNVKQFRERRERLMKRAGTVAGGLEGMGLNVALLDSQSLIELYYTSYNPELLDTQTLPLLQELSVEPLF